MGTSNKELDQMVKCLGLTSCYLGTFDKSFPGFNAIQNKYAMAIVNTGSQASGGIHWLAFTFNPKQQTVYLFDPFGFSDQQLMKEYRFSYESKLRHTALSRSDRCIKFEKNTQGVQCCGSGACGLFCILFLYSFSHYPNSPYDNKVMDMVKGYNPKELTSPASIATAHANEDKLHSWLRAHCSFYVNNVNTVLPNTSCKIQNH
ncbi:protease [White sturgeon adenovirus 1]|uniref:Protease n=1 Tax=White sturgeon adenovirus 1 TaxID=2580388 RepID=A0A4P8PIU1_9ADEN|nr:protease [White sturgeon adenovirus 1]QCQ84159.1 protease [White sturgeon adenovirus 1]